MATIAANPEYDDLGQGLNFYDELTTDRFDEIDDRIKSILGNTNMKVIDTIEITNEQLLENGLDLKTAKHTPVHLNEVTQALLVAAAPPLPPPDKDENIGFMFPPVMRRHMTNSTASKEAIYRLRKQALAVIEAGQLKADKEYRNFLVQVRYLAGATLAVTGTCVVAFVVITMGAPALLNYAFETGLMSNVYFQATIIPMLETFFPFTINQLQALRAIMAIFQTIGEGPLKELFKKIKETGKDIFTIDEAAIDSIGTATPALKPACDALKSFKILILIQFINTEEFADFEKKSGKAYTALKSVGPQLLDAILTRDYTKLMTPDVLESLQQFSKITPMFTQFLTRLKFVFDKGQMVIKFATAKDSTEMYRYLAEGPANIFLQSRYTQKSVFNAIDKRLEDALISFGIPLGNDKLWSIRPIKIVGEGVEHLTFGAISADTTGSIITFLTPNGEQIRQAFSHGINTNLFNGANQTVRMITTNVLGIKDKPAAMANTGPDDDDTNSPKSKRRRELLKKGLSGDALVKVLDDEFGRPEDIVGPDADLVKGLPYEFRKFWKGLSKNWNDKKSPQARLLSILFTGTIGTCIFTELFIDPSKGPSESTIASLLYLIDPIIKLLKNFIVTFGLYELGPELNKTILLVQELLLALSNRIRKSIGSLMVYVTKVKNSTTIKNNTLLNIGLDIVGTIVRIFEGVGYLFWNYAIDNNISSIATLLSDNSMDVHLLINAFTMNNVYDILDRCHQFFRKKGQEFTFNSAFDFAREIIRLDRTSNIRAPIDILETNTDNCYTNSVDSIKYDLIKQFVKMIPGGAEIPPYNCLKVSDAVVHFNNFHMIYTGAEGENLAKDTTARRAYLLLLSMGQRMNPPKSLEDLLSDREILEILRVMGIKCYRDEIVQPTDFIRKPEDISIKSIKEIAMSMDSTILQDYTKDLEDELVSQLLKTGFFGKTKEEVRTTISKGNPIFNPTLNPVITGILSPENQMEIFGEMIQYANSRISEKVFRGSILSLFEGKPKEKLMFSFLNEGGEAEYMTVNNADPNFIEINLAEIDSYGTKTVGVLSPDTQRLVYLFGKDGTFRSQAEDILRAGDKIYLNNQSSAKIAKELFDQNKKGIILGNNILKFEKEINTFIRTKFGNNPEIKILDKYNDKDMADYDKTFNKKVTRFLKSFVDMYGVPIFYNGFGGAEQVTQEEIQGAAEYIRTLPQYMEGKTEEDLTTEKILDVLKTNLPLRNQLIGYMREKVRLYHARQGQELAIEYNVDANLPGAFNTLNLNSSGKFKELMEHVFSSFGTDTQLLIDSDPDIIKYKTESPKPSEYYLRIIEILQYKGRYDDVRSLLIFLHLGFTPKVQNEAFLNALNESWRHYRTSPEDLRTYLREDIPDVPLRNIRPIQPVKPSGVTSVLIPQPNTIIQEELSILDVLKKLLLNTVKGIGDKRLPFLIKNPFVSSDLNSKIIMSSELRRVLEILNGKEVNDAEYEKRMRPTVNNLVGTGEDYHKKDIEYYADLINNMFAGNGDLFRGVFGENKEYPVYQYCIRTQLATLYRGEFIPVDTLKTNILLCLRPLLTALDSDINSSIKKKMDTFHIKLLTSKLVTRVTEIIKDLESFPERKEELATSGGIESILTHIYSSELEYLKQKTIEYNTNYNETLSVNDIPKTVQIYINIRRGQILNEGKKEPLENELGGIKIDSTFWQRLLTAWSKSVNGLVKIETPSTAPAPNKGPAAGPGQAPAGPGAPGAPGKGHGHAEAKENQAQTQAKGQAESESLGSLLREGQELGLITEISPPIEKNEESLLESITESLMNMLANLFDLFNRIGGGNSRNRGSGSGKNPFQPTSGTTATDTDIKRETGFDQKCIELRENYIIKGSKVEWLPGMRPPDLSENFNLELCLKTGLAPKIVFQISNLIKNVIEYILGIIINTMCSALGGNKSLGCGLILRQAFWHLMEQKSKREKTRLKSKIKLWRTRLNETKPDDPLKPFDANTYFTRSDASMEDMRDFILITIMMMSNQGDDIIKDLLYGKPNQEYNIFGRYKPTVTSSIAEANAIAYYASDYNTIISGLNNLFLEDNTKDIFSRIEDIMTRIPKVIVGDVDASDIFAPAYYGDKGTSAESINPWRVFSTFMQMKQQGRNPTDKTAKNEFIDLITLHYTGIIKDFKTSLTNIYRSYFLDLPESIVFNVGEDDKNLKAQPMDSRMHTGDSSLYIFRRKGLTGADIKNIYKEIIKSKPENYETILSEYPEWTTRSKKNNVNSNEIIDKIIDKYKLYLDDNLVPEAVVIDDETWKTIFISDNFFLLKPPPPQEEEEPPPPQPPQPPPPPPATLKFTYNQNISNNLRDVFDARYSFLRQGNHNIKDELKTGNSGSKNFMGIFIPYKEDDPTYTNTIEASDFNDSTKLKWRKSLYPDPNITPGEENQITTLWAYTDTEFLEEFTKNLDITFNKNRYPLYLKAEVDKAPDVMWSSISERYEKVCTEIIDSNTKECIYILKEDIELSKSKNRLGGIEYGITLCKAYFSKKNAQKIIDKLPRGDLVNPHDKLDISAMYNFDIFTEQNKLSFFDLSVIITSSSTHPDVSVGDNPALGDDDKMWIFNVINDDNPQNIDLKKRYGKLIDVYSEKISQFGKKIKECAINPGECVNDIDKEFRKIRGGVQAIDNILFGRSGWIRVIPGTDMPYDTNVEPRSDIPFREEGDWKYIQIDQGLIVNVGNAVGNAVVNKAVEVGEAVLNAAGDVVVAAVEGIGQGILNDDRRAAEWRRSEAARYKELMKNGKNPSLGKVLTDLAAAAAAAPGFLKHLITGNDAKTKVYNAKIDLNVANEQYATVMAQKQHDETIIEPNGETLHVVKLRRVKDYVQRMTDKLKEAIAAYDISKAKLLKDIKEADDDVKLKDQRLKKQKGKDGKDCIQIEWKLDRQLPRRIPYERNLCIPLEKELIKAEKKLAQLKVQEEWIEIVKENGGKCINIFTLKEITCPTSQPPP